MQLATQHVEGLRRGGGYAHQHILQCAQLQEALQPRRAVFRALAFVAVRQQQGQAGHAAPPARRQPQVVDHHLRTIGKVAKLAFPDAQGVGVGGGEAIFERHHRFFAE